MIKLIIKKFIKNNEETTNSKIKEKYGILSGVLGIICNIILFGIKLTIGLLINAFSIVSDAINNLTDSFSSIVSIISAKLSNKSPDKNHPFGHGRIEYIATLIVSFVIILLGFELLVTSIEKIINPNNSSLIINNSTWIMIIILTISLLIKIWMFSYNRYIAKKINSTLIKATSIDSIIDALITFVLILSLVCGLLWFPNKYVYIDAILSCFVAIFIFYNGIKIIKNTANILIGKSINQEDKEKIKNIILNDKNILGYHDLLVHEYGIDNKFASVHVEIDSNMNILEAHEIIDKIEKKCYELTKIYLTIHVDPIDINSNEYQKIKMQIDYYLKPFKHVTFHDLRIVNKNNQKQILVDLILSFEIKDDEKNKIISILKNNIDPNYDLQVNVINQFVD